MRNLQCIGRGQPWNQKVLELVRGSPLTAFDFRSGLIWMWWFLQRFAAKRIGRYRKWQAKNGGSIDNLRESREHRWAFCPTHRCRWPQRPRRRDGLIRTDRQHHHASHERWQSSPSARPSWSSLPIANRNPINCCYIFFHEDDHVAQHTHNTKHATHHNGLGSLSLFRKH